MLTRALRFLALSILLLSFKHRPSAAQAFEGISPLSTYPRDRILRPIDDQRRIALLGNLHPLARPEFRLSAVSPDFPMNRMVLVLKPDAEQQEALDQLVAAQHDPSSPYYHQWITPERFGELYGVSETDLTQISNWLQANGMKVEEVSAGRRAIVFSGTAAQVNAAFHARIQSYRVNGEVHHANENDPEIPQALAGVVDGVVSLHDFRSQAMHSLLQKPAPGFTYGSAHYMAPGDFATIYNLGPLYQQSIDGTGQSVAIVGRSNIYIADVHTFRSSFGLPANDPQVILNGADPGIANTGEESEAILDVEWSGAVARKAAIKFVVSASTNSSDGVYLSAQYIVSHNVAPVMSVSFGLCEAALGSSGNSFLNSLWQQAAAQGITVFVSSGDSGAAGCDYSSATTATHGLGINGLCSSPYSVCVGGTQFNDTASPGLYWSPSNASGTQGSALSYIPEQVWNESGSSGLWSGGGGASILYPKPSWQSGAGVPADGKRDVPDVSLTAAVHDGYLIYMNGGLMVAGGTSASSPSFAGLMALVVQQAGTPQGNANPAFYTIASTQQAGGVAVFHDITTGNNTVPGVTGYNAGTGYDQGTGLGSVDANLLVTHWSNAGTPVPSFLLNASKSSLALAAADSTSLTATVTVSGGFNAAVAFSVSTLPTGVTASFTPSTLVAPGSGTVSLGLTASPNVTAGTYSITVTATGGGITRTLPLTLTVSIPATFSLTASASSVSVAPGKTGTVTFTTAISSTFKSAVSLSVKGQPTGLTASFSPASIPSPGSGRSTLTLSAASSTAPGTYSLVITASGAGVTRTATITLNVPGFTLSASPATLSLAAGKTATVNLTTSVLGGFSSAVTLSASGAPAGVTTRFSPATIVAPGSGSSVLTLSSGSATKAGAYKLTLTAIGGGVTRTSTLTINATTK